MAQFALSRYIAHEFGTIISFPSAVRIGRKRNTCTEKDHSENGLFYVKIPHKRHGCPNLETWRETWCRCPGPLVYLGYGTTRPSTISGDGWAFSDIGQRG
jgi:hypothetical protein